MARTMPVAASTRVTWSSRYWRGSPSGTPRSSSASSQGSNGASIHDIEPNLKHSSDTGPPSTQAKEAAPRLTS